MIDPRYDYKELHTKRASGVLMPVFSLPSQYGIGTFGDAAYRFIDFLKHSSQTYWQILPLCPTGYGNSPYSAVSSFAGNPYFIDLDILYQQGLLCTEDLESAKNNSDLIDYGFLYRTRIQLFKKAYSRFSAQNGSDAELEVFLSKHAYWLHDYALFSAIRTHYGDSAWFTWPDSLKSRETGALRDVQEKWSETMRFAVFLQYLFEQQWQDLKSYASQAGVHIIGDLPIYSAHDSADVWAHREAFCVENDGSIAFVGGCPPGDFENAGDPGQVWGTPVYNWDYLHNTAFEWLIKRFTRQADFYDVLRLDHFRGYESFWKIPFGQPARSGSWESGGGAALFSQLKQKLPALQIIAEDLGFITKEVFELRKHFGYPSMRILQNGLHPDWVNEHTPHHYEPNTVLYFGIHDNEPLSSWLKQRSAEDLTYLYDYFNISRQQPIHFECMKALSASIADTVIFQVQDILFLDERSRINTPGNTEHNWEFKLSDSDFEKLEQTKSVLEKITKLYGRK